MSVLPYCILIKIVGKESTDPPAVSNIATAYEVVVEDQSSLLVLGSWFLTNNKQSCLSTTC